MSYDPFAALLQNPRAALRGIDGELAKREFREFVRLAWSQAEPAYPFLPNWHIDAIADHLQAVTEGQIQRLLINIPPGHAKSLMVSVLWPAWIWAREPKWRGIFCSYGAELAIRDSVRCRAVITSPWYRETFQPTWKLSGDQNVKSWFENTSKGFRLSLGVGGKATGFRGDAIVVDDPLNAKDQFSDAALKEVVFWWDQVMSNRLNDPAKGVKVIIMQRLSQRDLAAHVMERGGYEHLNLPSEFEPDRRARTCLAGGWEDPRKDFGELLFPQLFPKPVLETAKVDLGSQGYAAQHQQRPSPLSGGVLKRHWWRYWVPAGINLPAVRVQTPDGNVAEIAAAELPETFDQQLQSWDCAFKDLDTSDYVVGGVIAQAGSARYFLDLRRARLDLPGTVQAVRDLSAQWPEAALKLIEDKANGPAVIQSLRKEVTGLVEVSPEGGKMSRAAAAAPEVEAGNWYLPHPSLAPWVTDFIEECADFPNGRNDDQVDMFSQASNRLRSGAEPGIRFFTRR